MLGPADAVAATSVVGLRQGATGPAVQAVQEKLIGFGYYVAGGADGNFGTGTTAALRVFQQQNGLNPTGVVTENTARYLGLAGGVPAATATPQAPQALAAPATPTAAAATGQPSGCAAARPASRSARCSSPFSPPGWSSVAVRTARSGHRLTAG